MIECDNKSVISIVENPVQLGRTKHINIKNYTIRETEKLKEIKMVYVNFNSMLLISSPKCYLNLCLRC